MGATLVLFFLGAAPVGAAPAGHAQRAALASYARAHLVRFAPPAPDPSPPLPYDATLSGHADALLDAAAIAVAALDAASARARLGEARQLLDAHPELPESAFLMAEWLRTAASAALAEGDADQARALSSQADSLEGARAAAYGAPAERARGEPRLEPERLELRGLSPGDVVYWDGRESAREVSAAPGPHHARVVRDGRALWAGWVTVARSSASVRLDVPPLAPCTLTELRAARLDASRASPPPGARCPRWALAREAPGGAILIAICGEARCGQPIEWRASDGGFYAGPPQPRAESGWRGWATALIAGVGVTAATGFVMWQAGVFAHDAAPATTFRFYGP